MANSVVWRVCAMCVLSLHEFVFSNDLFFPSIIHLHFVGCSVVPQGKLQGNGPCELSVDDTSSIDITLPKGHDPVSQQLIVDIAGNKSSFLVVRDSCWRVTLEPIEEAQGDSSLFRYIKRGGIYYTAVFGDVPKKFKNPLKYKRQKPILYPPVPSPAADMEAQLPERERSAPEFTSVSPSNENTFAPLSRSGVVDPKVGSTPGEKPRTMPPVAQAHKGRPGRKATLAIPRLKSNNPSKKKR